MKPYYEQDGITIYHGDCRKILPMLTFSADPLLLFDPPYGINHSSNRGSSWQGTRIANDSDLSIRDWIISDFKSLPMAVFGKWTMSAPAEARACLIWDKGPAFGMGDLSLPWKPSWEQIFILGDGWKGRRDEGVLRGHMVVSWETKGRRHPHEKPVSLMSHLLGKHPAELVIDPCCGTGPSLVAAKLAGRRAIGIELDERYCEIAANRLAQGVLFGAAADAGPN